MSKDEVDLTEIKVRDFENKVAEIERKHAGLLQWLKVANEKAKSLDVYVLGVSELTEERLIEFEKKVAEAESRKQLLNRLNVVNRKAASL